MDYVDIPGHTHFNLIYIHMMTVLFYWGMYIHGAGGISSHHNTTWHEESVGSIDMA